MYNDYWLSIEDEKNPKGFKIDPRIILAVLFLFMILLLILLPYGLASSVNTNYTQDANVTYTKTQTVNALEGLIWCNNEPVTINTIIKDSVDTANQCAIFDNSTYTHDSPLASGTFSGNDCAINYYVSEPKCLVYALDLEPHNNFIQSYNDDITPFPIITSKGNFSGGVASATARNVLYYQVIPFGIKKIIVNTSVSVPSMTLNGLWSNTTTNMTVYYNATFQDSTTDLMNCSFYADSVIQSSAEVNLSATHTFFYDWGYIDHDFLFNVSCTNFENYANINTAKNVRSYNYNALILGKLNSIEEINNNIYEVLNMLPLVLIYAVLMFLGYWLMISGNTISGWLLWIVSFGFDFLFAGLFYAQYYPEVTTQTFKGVMILVFLYFIVIWIVGKGLSFIMLQRRIRVN